MKKGLRIAFAVLFILALFLYARVLLNEGAPPQPIHGVLDLRETRTLEQGIIKLNGEWSFYWNRLVDYRDALSLNKPDAYVEVPGFWREYRIDGVQLSGTGYATYKLKVKTGRVGERMGLKIQPFSSAFKVYINNQVVAENGVVSSDPDKAITRYKPAVVTFDAPGEEFDIIVQAANLSFPRGGFWYPMYLGTADEILEMQLHKSEKEMLFFGGILTVLISNLFMFLMRRNERLYLYIMLFSGIIQIYMMVTGEFYLTNLFPETPFSVAMFLVYMAYYWVIVFFTGFMKQMFPQEVSSHIYKGMFSLASVLTLLTLFLPHYVYTFVIQVYDYVIVIGLFYTFYRLILAVRNGRQGAGLMLAASVGLLFTGIHDLLYQRAYVSPFGELLSIGAFVLILCQSYVAAKKYTHSFRQVQQLSSQLLTLDKFNDAFLINTANELKTPVHGMMNLAEILVETENEKISEDGKRNLENINRVAKKLSGLIDDIVDLYQIRENRQSLNIRSFDCRATIQLVMDNLRPVAEQKGLRMINHLRVGSFYIKADEKRLKQIMYTLIENAIKFTDHGKITVEAYPSKDMVNIQVIDTGIGIAAKRREALSANISGETPSQGKPEAGPGLAFYIASWIARYMEGDLRVKWSEIGKGTCLELTLPSGERPPDWMQGPMQDSIYEDSFAQAAAASDSGEPVKPDIHDHINENSSTILIVDDEPTNLLVLKEYFSKKGHEIITARTGEQALELLENNKTISMILLDVLLPDSTGYSICRKIREKFTLYDLPVILLTLRNTPEEIHECMSAGANDLIIKPFVNSELNARVLTHLELKQTLKRAVEMEVMFLQSQIKPHFIYNALSVITGLCFADGQRAGELMIQLGNYLRRTFEVDYRKNEVWLEDEISLICSYVEIEKARFGHRIVVVFDLDQEAMKARIPPLILQPLVENAIRHGILNRIQGGTVHIRARKDGGFLELRVEDDGIGMSSERIRQLMDRDSDHTGVALKNINKRMLSYYDREVEVISELDKGTTMILRIPFKH